MLRRDRTFHGWLRLVVWVVSLALTVGVMQGINVTSAEAEITSETVPCLTASGQPATDSTSRSLESTTRCIDGWSVNSRSKIKDVCLQTLKAVKPGEEYTRAECGGVEANQQVEFIAQARGISQLDLDEGPIQLGISPTLQWEVQQPGGPSDLIRYKLNMPKQVLELVEYKVDRNQSREVLEAQVGKYERNWLGRGTLRRSTRMASQLFGDVFKVDTGHPCPNGVERIVDTFITEGNPDVDGVVMIRKVKTTDCNNPGNERDIPRHEPEDRSLNEHWWEPILLSIGSSVLVESSDEEPSIEDCAFFCVSQDGWFVAGMATTLSLQLLRALGTLTMVEAGVVSLPFVLGVTVAAALLYAIFDQLLPNVFGDPHLTTLDGLTYDFQSVGEFDLLRSETAGLDVQARFVPAGGSTTVSVASDYAFDLNGYQVQIDSDGDVKVDGKTYEVPNNNYLYFGNGSALSRTDDLLTAVWPGTTDRPMLMYKTSARSMRMYLPDGVRTTGLLGNHDGIKTNDLRVRGGAQLAATASPGTIHGTFADSWRISQSDSLFSYGSGESTQTFTNLSRPSDLVSVDDFSQAARDTAERQCRDAGVLEGSTLRACMYDRLVSDSDEFLASAVDVTGGGTAGADKDLDGDGHAAEDYESEVAANFNYGRLGSDPTFGKFAGPFKTTDGYGFSAHSEAPHEGAQISFDLIVIGDWSTTAEQNIKLDIDGQQKLSATLTGNPNTEAPSSEQLGSPTDSGVFASGQKYWVFPVTAASSEPSAADLTGEVKLTGSGAARAFGIDNLSLNAQLVDPDRFNINVGAWTSPTDISDAQPGDGAGNIESKLARDEYTFDVPAGTKRLVVANEDCATVPGLRWHLKTVSGADVHSGTCSDHGLTSLSQGTYAISFTSQGDPVGPYRVDLYFAPDPQEFDVTLSNTPVSVSNGAPEAGAGNIETLAAKDVYRFTVPTGGRTLMLDSKSCPAFLGARWTLIDRSDGSTVDTDYCETDRQFGGLSAGSYQLEYDSPSGKTGANSFDLFFVPAPEIFDVTPSTVPLEIGNGQPAAGAGNIETVASEDRYRFTIPIGGRSLSINNRTCPNIAAGSNWTLVNRSTDTIVGIDSCFSDKQFSNLPAGDYELQIKSNGTAKGTYTLNLMYIPDPEIFDLTLTTTPQSISDGSPANGAGNIETEASKDYYKFTVPAGGRSVMLDSKSCSHFLGTRWTLRDLADNSLVESNYCEIDKQFTDLGAGNYQLEWAAELDRTGTYGFDLFFVPEPDTFTVSLSSTPLAVSASVPSTGAGTLENVASKDIYRFTVPAGGRPLFVDNKTCPHLNTANDWKVVNRTTNDTTASGHCYEDSTVELAAGDYQFEVSTTNSEIGNYSLALFFVPDPDIANLTLTSSSQTVSNGAPTSGLGDLETIKSKDIYRFTIPAGGQEVYVDNKTCLDYWGARWTLVNRGTGSLVESQFCETQKTFSGLAPGDYQLEYTSLWGTGTYSFDIYLVTPPDVMDLALSTTPLAISNGVPATGAGNIETGASKDFYRFTVPAGGRSLLLDSKNCPAFMGNRWKLINRGTNTTIADEYCETDKTFDNLPSGDYQLEYSTPSNKTGTYALELFFVPDPDTFDLGLSTTPLAISNAVPAAGAGNLETVGSKDVYQFTVPTGGRSTFLDNGTCPGSNYGMQWKLVNRSNNSTVGTDNCSVDKKFTDLPAGNYQLEYTSNNGQKGPYSIKVYFVPDPDKFSLSLTTTPLAVSNGVPSAGAGNLETVASKDVYQLTVPSGGRSAFLDNGTCPGSNYGMQWKLVNRTDNSTVGTDNCSVDKTFADLPAGNYQLEYTSNNSQQGPYDFKVFFVPDPDVFGLTLSTSPLTISNGVPAAGAGNLETVASKDVYQFTVPAGGRSTFLDNGACPFFGMGMQWKLVNRSDNSTVGTENCGTDRRYTNLSAGNYQLEYTANYGQTGPYDLKVSFDP